MADLSQWTEQEVNRIIDPMQKMTEKISNEKVRSIIGDSHVQVSKCYSDKSVDLTDVEACAERSLYPAKMINKILEANLSHYQKSVQSSIESCQNGYHNNKSTSTSFTFRSAESEYKSCISKCVEASLINLKSLETKLETDIDQLTSKLKR